MRPVRWLLLAALAATLVVAGVAAGHGAKGAKGGEVRTANGTDRAFVALMIPHHEGGVALGRLAAERGSDPRVVRLGAEIVAEQAAEIGDLRAMASRLGVTPMMPPAVEEREMLDMDRLESLAGAEFDRMWLDMISAHHAAAIQTAIVEKTGGGYPPALSLARSIVASQSAQLAELTALTRELEG